MEGKIENVEACLLQSLFYENTLLFTSTLINTVFWKDFTSYVNNAIAEGRIENVEVLPHACIAHYSLRAL